RRLSRDGVEIALTSGEYALLRSLASNPGRSLGRERLLEMVQQEQGQNPAQGRAEVVTARSIDVQVLRLRRLIEPDPAKPRFIQTVWGVGYRFVPEGAAP
ncbi:MAG: two-component system response regulator OmpR, partial [Pseudomonadota bacterium]